MFSCFKSLNKKFICSICSACLLCMTGVSQLRASESTTDESSDEVIVDPATIGENAFLTNTLKNSVYSSELLPIFSQKPFLYVDSQLSVDEIPDQDKIPFGNGEPTSVYIAAMPTDDISSDESDKYDESSFDNLTWYELDDNSWNKLWLKDPGTAKIFYHVVSTDRNIEGTIDDTTSLSVVSVTNPIDLISDD